MYKVFEPKKEVIFINTEKQLGNSSKGNRSKNTNEKEVIEYVFSKDPYDCLLYTSPSPRDLLKSRMPSSA